MSKSMSTVRAASRGLCHAQKRLLHQSPARNAITRMEMPAMSPTMTEGAIHSWKVKEGDAFSATDVLLELETDKATIDVEAQEDGIMGKIIVATGTKNVQVGSLIALLAEEGDDIANLEVPKEEPKKEEKPKETSTSAPTPPPKAESKASTGSTSTTPASNSHDGGHPTHSKPLFPSVLRLLAQHGVQDAEKIKGTGIRGMLTKGDVLAHLKLVKSPNGSYTIPVAQPHQGGKAGLGGTPKAEPAKPLDGPSLRRLIVSTMLQSSIKSRNPTPLPVSHDFDSIIADYLPPAPPIPNKGPVSLAPPSTSGKSGDFLDGLV